MKKEEDKYAREDSNTTHSGVKNGDCQEARHKIRHTARTKRFASEPKPMPNPDPDLAFVQTHWAKLPNTARSAIHAIVRAVANEVGG